MSSPMGKCTRSPRSPRPHALGMRGGRDLKVIELGEPIENVPCFDEVMGIIKAQNEAIVSLKEQVKTLEGRAGASEEKLAALATSAAATKTEAAQTVKSNLDLAYEKALKDLGITPVSKE